jgi:hypothetical protein
MRSVGDGKTGQDTCRTHLNRDDIPLRACATIKLRAQRSVFGEQDGPVAWLLRFRADAGLSRLLVHGTSVPVITSTGKQIRRTRRPHMPLTARHARPCRCPRGARDFRRHSCGSPSCSRMIGMWSTCPPGRHLLPRRTALRGAALEPQTLGPGHSQARLLQPRQALSQEGNDQPNFSSARSGPGAGRRHPGDEDGDAGCPSTHWQRLQLPHHSEQEPMRPTPTHPAQAPPPELITQRSRTRCPGPITPTPWTGRSARRSDRSLGRPTASRAA